MILAATGHRPDKLNGFSDSAFNALVTLATAYLTHHKRTVIGTIDSTISGMALGWDQAWAQASFDCGIPFTAAVPFFGQESRWPLKSQAAYQALLSKASNIVYVCSPDYAAWKMQRRNEWIVDHCDRLVALWDGGETGGTANCIRYAQEQGREIVNLWPKFEKISKSAQECLLFPKQ
jgi:uncharacterized phage-like protein YoqJ